MLKITLDAENKGLLKTFLIVKFNIMEFDGHLWIHITPKRNRLNGFLYDKFLLAFPFQLWLPVNETVFRSHRRSNKLFILLFLHEYVIGNQSPRSKTKSKDCSVSSQIYQVWYRMDKRYFVPLAICCTFLILFRLFLKTEYISFNQVQSQQDITSDCGTWPYHLLSVTLSPW